MKTVIGFDIAGINSSNGFVRADRVGNEINVKVFKNTIFQNHTKKKIKLFDDISNSITEGSVVLNHCFSKGFDVVVDTPLDLQGMFHELKGSYRWETEYRPIDIAYLVGLSPIANRIGGIAARFRRYFTYDKPLHKLLNNQLFETYPKVILKLLGLLPLNSYKSEDYNASINYVTPGETNIPCWKDQNGKKSPLATIATGLGIIPKTNNHTTIINSDDLDAILCALTRIVDEKDRLYGQLLDIDLSRRLQDKLKMNMNNSGARSFVAPKGYVLLKNLHNYQIKVETVDVKNKINTLIEHLS